MRFDNLPTGDQVALAAWAVLLKSYPPEPGELTGFPCGLDRAVGDICVTVGIRTRKARNNMRRHDANPRNIRKKLRPAKKRVAKQR